jgi:mono/diheme cytochrome c family protein
MLSFVLACGGGGGTDDADSNTPAARGERNYRVYCTICHNTNPSADGAVGPAVKGSSRELIEARLLRAAYPAGYTPKRATKAMPAYPHLAHHIDDLVAFLNE